MQQHDMSACIRGKLQILQAAKFQNEKELPLNYFSKKGKSLGTHTHTHATSRERVRVTQTHSPPPTPCATKHREEGKETLSKSDSPGSRYPNSRHKKLTKIEEIKIFKLPVFQSIYAIHAQLHWTRTRTQAPFYLESGWSPPFGEQPFPEAPSSRSSSAYGEHCQTRTSRKG